MIFVTVGTQLPFDRLLSFIDGWARDHDVAVFAQTGPSERNYSNIECKDFLNPEEFTEKLMQADLVVAHAGIGSIVTALSHSKPLIVVPRRADLHEHRNDHQMATAHRFVKNSSVNIAFDELELDHLLSQRYAFSIEDYISPYAPPDFLERIKSLING